MDRILVVVTARAPLADVMALAERSVRPDTGRVRVLYVRTWHAPARPARDLPPAGDGVDPETREQALELTSALVDEFVHRGVSADGLVLDAAPGGLGRLIARFARDWQTQAIVLGDRGPGDAVSEAIRADLRAGAGCALAFLGSV